MYFLNFLLSGFYSAMAGDFIAEVTLSKKRIPAGTMSLSALGASLLAGRGCLRSGAGKLTVHIPRNNNDIMQMSLPEAVLLKCYLPIVCGKEFAIRCYPD